MTMPAVRTTPPTVMSFVAIVFAVTRHVTNNAAQVMNRQLMAVRSYYGAPPTLEGRHARDSESGRAPVGRRRFHDDARHRQGRGLRGLRPDLPLRPATRGRARGRAARRRRPR